MSCKRYAEKCQIEAVKQVVDCGYSVAEGKRFRVLTIDDDFSRECAGSSPSSGFHRRDF